MEKQVKMTFKENMQSIIQDMKDLGFINVLKVIWNDLAGNRSLSGWLYLIILSSVPFILEFLNKDTKADFLGMTASFTGIVCVIFVAEGRASNYLFGLINSVIYLWLCLTAVGGAFYGEIITTVYFTVMQPVGLYLWLSRRHLKKENASFVAKHLDLKGWVKAIAGTAITWLLIGKAYQTIGSNRPYRDSVTDGTNIVGQWLMNEQYAEQWLFWIATNVFSIYLWHNASIHMQGMYWVYLVNSIVGWLQWRKQATFK